MSKSAWISTSECRASANWKLSRYLSPLKYPLQMKVSRDITLVRETWGNIPWQQFALAFTWTINLPFRADHTTVNAHRIIIMPRGKLWNTKASDHDELAHKACSEIAHILSQHKLQHINFHTQHEFTVWILFVTMFQLPTSPLVVCTTNRSQVEKLYSWPTHTARQSISFLAPNGASKLVLISVTRTKQTLFRLWPKSHKQISYIAWRKGWNRC